MSATTSNIVGIDNHSPPVCTLLGGSFDKLVQVLLGFIALSVLVFKRQREIPQRPIKIWLLDSSKQLVGAGIAHLANLAIAIILRRLQTLEQPPDECAYYFINFFIDTSIGVVVNWSLLTLLKYAAELYNWHHLKVPGYYGRPISYWTWTIQLLSWIFIILFTKLLLAFFIYGMEAPFANFAIWLFSPLAPYPKIELLIVMVACPCAMNALQFWVQDNFLKKSTDSGNLIRSTSPQIHSSDEEDNDRSLEGLEMRKINLV